MYESHEEMDAILNMAKNKLNEQNGIEEDELDYSDLINESLSVQSEPEPKSKEEQNIEGENQSDGAICSGDDEEFEELPRVKPYEELLFEDGPTVTQVKAWKKQYELYDIFVVEVLEEMFVCRTLNRYEYKQLIVMEDTDALQREEIICNTTVLFPEDLHWGELASMKAGIPSTLSEIVMEKSGFTRDYAVRVI